MKALWWILRRPVLLNRVLEDNESWKKLVDRKHGMTGGLPVITMDRLFDKDSISLGPMTFLDGGSLPTDMMLLAGLAESIPGCKYFEIGTWRGESAATIAPRAESVHTLCLSNEEMRSLGMPEASVASHMQFSGKLENVVQHRGNSRQFDFTIPGCKFDLIFIDGDHHYDTIVSDTRNVFRYLAHENSIVVWHDYGFHPDRVRHEVMAAILEGAGSSRWPQIYHVAHTICAVYAGKTCASRPAEFPVIPGEYYHVQLSRRLIGNPEGHSETPQSKRNPRSQNGIPAVKTEPPQSKRNPRS